MPPTMTTQSDGWPTAASQGGGTGGRAGSGGGRTRGHSGGQGNGMDDGLGGHVGRQGSKVNGGVNEVPDFSTIIAQYKGCTYKEFLACNPKEYDGKGGAIVYTRWIKKMESVHDMSGCRDSQRVKYNAGSFVTKVEVKEIVGIKMAMPSMTTYGMMVKMESVHDMSGCRDSQRVKYNAGSFEDFRTLTGEEFCLSNEMKKLETELWNHAMVGAGHAAYTDRFYELVRLVPHLVTPKSKSIRRYMYGLDLQIRGMVAAIEPKTIQKAVQIASTLTYEALRNGIIKKNPEKR
nr:reverse transcriptase domain-containing protein [Tanacetum cinerariifolium]